MTSLAISTAGSQIPLWIPVVVMAGALVLVNALAVGVFGEFEYWFAMVTSRRS